MTAEERLIAKIPTDLVAGKTQVGEFSVAYVKAGSGPALLLLHGLNMGWGQWYPNIAELAKHFTVYALDLPGAGRSTTFRVGANNFPLAILGVVEGFIREHNLLAPAIIGHSFGAWVALQIAVRKNVPVGRLVLMSPLGLNARTPAKYRPLGIRWLAWLLSRTVMHLNRENMKKFVTSVLFQPKTVSEEFIDYYYESLRSRGHEHPFVIINRLSGFFRMRKEFLFPQELSYSAAPVLMVIGAHDPITNIAGVRTHVFASAPGVRVEIMQESGHVPSTEQATEFNALVIQFLKNS